MIERILTLMLNALKDERTKNQVMMLMDELRNHQRPMDTLISLDIGTRVKEKGSKS